MTGKKTKKGGRRPSMYIPEEMHSEVLAQCARYGISASKCIQDAWRLAKVYDGPIPDGCALFRDGPIATVPADDEEDEDA